MSSAIATFCSTSSTAVPAGVHFADRAEHDLHHRGRQSERWLVQQQQARVAPSTRGRSPPSAVGRRTAQPAGASSLSRTAGNSVHTYSSDRSRCLARRAQVAAHLEVLAHAHAREQPTAFRHDCDAGAAVAMRRAAASCRCPSIVNVPALAGCSPAIALMSVVLPAPLGPTTHASSPARSASDTPHNAGAAP